MSKIVVNSMPADGLALLGAWISTETGTGIVRVLYIHETGIWDIEG